MLLHTLTGEPHWENIYFIQKHVPGIQTGSCSPSVPAIPTALKANALLCLVSPRSPSSLGPGSCFRLARLLRSSLEVGGTTGTGRRGRCGQPVVGGRTWRGPEQWRRLAALWGLHPEALSDREVVESRSGEKPHTGWTQEPGVLAGQLAPFQSEGDILKESQKRSGPPLRSLPQTAALPLWQSPRHLEGIYILQQLGETTRGCLRFPLCSAHPQGGCQHTQSSLHSLPPKELLFP